MIIPNWYPRKLLVAEEKIFIGPILGYSLSVIVEGENLLIWLWDSPESVSPAIFTILVLASQEPLAVVAREKLKP